MNTATMPIRLLAAVAIVLALVLGIAIGYVISDATGSDMPRHMMSGMDMGQMAEHMDQMQTHMNDMGSMMGGPDRWHRGNMPMHGNN